ncbi:MAG: TonB-dependent receptor plug domain-containing protein [Parvibaculaceae bacterium]
MKNKIAFALVGLSPWLWAPDGRAEDQLLDEIIISANRTPTEAAKVGSSVDVITGEEIARQGMTFVKDYLALLPGVSFSQNGPPGTTSTISIRGAFQRYVTVLIDGIDISDPTGAQVAAQLDQLLVRDVERIEVLKGSQSTLYGGDAVGGVISITTKGAEKNGLSLRFGGEYGAHDTFMGSSTLDGRNDRGSFALTAQSYTSDGFSSADERNGNDEKDGYDNVTLSGRGEYRLADNFTLFASGRYLDSRAEYDDYAFPAGPVDDLIGNHVDNEILAGRTGFNLALLDGRLRNTATLQAARFKRDDHSSFPGWYDGDRLKADYQLEFDVTGWLSLMGGGDWERTTAETSGNSEKESAEVWAGWAQLLISPIDDLSITLGARNDEHDAFGPFDTYRATAAYFFAAGTKIRASVGTGFRAPSLFELYDPTYGNPDLEPEESFSWDAGIEQSFLSGRASASATYFELDTDNLIEYDFATSRYFNLPGKSPRHGIELAANLQATDWLTLGGSYTYIKARDADGNRLVRIPKHDFGLQAGIAPIERVQINVTGQYVKDVVDTGDIALKSYFLLNARLSYDINDNLTAYLRGENLLDEHYQTAFGYGTSRLAVYTGISASF